MSPQWGLTECPWISNATRLIYNCIFDHNSNNGAVWAYSSSHPNLRNCVVTGTTHANATLTDCITPAQGYLIAPALRDGHLIDTATECFGIADPKAVTGDDTLGKMTGIPEAYRDKDLDGNPVSLVAGELTPGCYQRPKTPAGGMTSFYGDGNLDLYIDGNFIRRSSTNYFYAMSWPTQHTFKAVSIKEGWDFLCTKTRRDNSWFYSMLLPVDTNNFCRFVPAPAGHSYSFANYSGAQWWIDCNSTAATEDGTAANPFKTFAVAVTNKPGCVFRVKAGTYDRGTFANTSEGYVARMGLKRNYGYRFIAEEGPEKTIIVGASDPDAPAADRGCGANAVRLVGYWYHDDTAGLAMSYFHGFTLTGGRSVLGSEADGTMTYQSGGAVIRAQLGGETQYWLVRSLMTDCIITNNVAAHGPITGAQLARCLVADNHAIGKGNYASVCRGGFASGCLFRNNTATKAIWGDSMVAIQCTMDDPEILNPFYDCNVYNCVVKVSPNQTSTPRNYRGTVRVGFGTQSIAYPYAMYSVDPFADAATGDYRLLEASTAAHFGISKIGDNDMYETWVRHCPDDFDGKPLAFDADGRLPPGAFQARAVGLAVKAAATQDRGISPSDFVRLGAEGKVTLTATEAETRAFKCFAVNGVEQPVSGTSYTYMRPTPPPTETDDVVKAVYYTDFYVNPDPAVGSDAVTGCDPDHPALTLSNALSRCVSGDTVHAAPGVYDQKGTLYTSAERFDTTGEMCVWTRAYVPAGVTLEATGSREETIIKGAESPEAYEGDYGCGPWATRCAILRKDAKLRGFTLTDGHTATKEHGGSGDSKSGDNQSCGGALLFENTTLENCVISNCVSGRSVVWGKGDASSTIRNCVVVGNRDLQNMLGLLRGLFVDGCYVANNISYSLCYFTTRCANSTFGPGNTASSASGYREASLFRGSDNKTNQIVNSVIHTRNICESNQKIKMTRCVFDQDIGSTSQARIVETNDCIATARANLTFEPNGAPVIGENPAVDAGTLSDWTDSAVDPDKDVWGHPRVFNGRMDIGAVEADWRPVYAQTLCKSRRFSVTAADPEVVAATNVAGTIVGVTVPAGKTLACAFAAGSQKAYACAVDLAAGASLDVTQDGSTTTLSASGEVPLEFASSAASTLTFSAANGLALLNPFVSNSGTILTFR